MFSLAQRFVRYPQQVYLRRALFQIHLWVGLLTALYIALIGLSGAILVFKDDLARIQAPRVSWADALDPKQQISAGAVLRSLHEKAPAQTPTLLLYPTRMAPYFSISTRMGSQERVVLMDAKTAAILRDGSSSAGWLGILTEFHNYLFLPHTQGLLWNSLGAGFLLLLTVSGIVIWWPGVAAWKRGFRIDFSLKTKRVIRDGHAVVGFYALTLISFWALTGMLFGLFRPTPPNLLSDHSGNSALIGVDELVAQCRRVLPLEQPFLIRLPQSASYPIYTINLVKTAGMTYTESDAVSIDARDGKVVKVYRHDAPKSLGVFLFSLVLPLHFGTEWGMAVKILYFLGGLSLPVLAITGVLMYWHRYLSKRWSTLCVGSDTTE